MQQSGVTKDQAEQKRPAGEAGADSRMVTGLYQSSLSSARSRAVSFILPQALCNLPSAFSAGALILKLLIAEKSCCAFLQLTAGLLHAALGGRNPFRFVRSSPSSPFSFRFIELTTVGDGDCSGSNLARSAHLVLERGQLFGPDRSSRVKLASGDPDFRAEAEFSAVGILG